MMAFLLISSLCVFCVFRLNDDSLLKPERLHLFSKGKKIDENTKKKKLYSIYDQTITHSLLIESKSPVFIVDTLLFYKHFSPVK